MLHLNITPILRLRGIYSAYSFLMKQGFSHAVARNLAKNSAANIKLEHLTKLCEALNCTPNDLMFDDGTNNALGAEHELKKLKKDRFVNTEFIKNFPLEKLQELQAYAEKLKKNEL